EPAFLRKEIGENRCKPNTITAPPSGSLQNGREKVKTVPLYLEEDIRPEMKEDIYDPTYQDEEGPPPKLEYVWRNIILMALLLVGGLYGITLMNFAVGDSTVFSCSVCIIYIFGLGITAGAHRLWNHRTYKARLSLRLSLIRANTVMFQNDVYEWKHTLTLTIPAVASSLMWVGCLCSNTRLSKRRAENLDMSDLKAEKLVMFQWRKEKETQRHMDRSPDSRTGYAFVTCLSNMVLCSVEKNDGFLVRQQAVLIHDILASSGVILGKAFNGFHNYHHAFPYNYSASEYRWHINFTTLFIDCMAALSLAYNRKEVSKSAAILARVKRTGDRSHNSG
uniref:Uncharacterized protein n=1 Tax=Mus spicilegus TaxID=10103 RepID=A0A8C6H2Y4_MUSSI